MMSLFLIDFLGFEVGCSLESEFEFAADLRRKGRRRKYEGGSHFSGCHMQLQVELRLAYHCY